jgi:hypothetical protein
MANCGPSYIILASIDRALIISQSASKRQRSTRRMAIISLLVITSFWLVFHSHALICIEIIQFAPNYFLCYYRPGAYTTFIAIFSLAISGLLALLSMSIAGIWAMKNIR